MVAKWCKNCKHWSRFKGSKKVKTTMRYVKRTSIEMLWGWCGCAPKICKKHETDKCGQFTVGK